MPKMRASFQGLVRLLARSLYPEPDVFVRELLQNAHDSIQLRRVHEPEPAGEIRIDMDESSRALSFSDNGTGMDRRDIEEFLSVIGSTGTGSRARELATRDVAVATIGQFGIGLLSAFVVAERIEVYTRKPMATQAWRWVNHGGEDYELDALPASAQPPGTRVVVTLAPDRTAFLDGRILRQTVRRYADFLPFPILLDGFGPINAVNAPWHEPVWRDPGERERLLTAFLNQRYADPPLVVIPVDLSNPRALGGLFIPTRYAPGGQAGGTVDLFQTRMSIRPNDAELLPEWARFVRGVVDCPDLQPTAARDNVVRDGVYHALRVALGELIVTALLDLAARDRPRFLQLCDWHHDAIKGMAAQHPDFGAAVLDHLPFETDQGQLTLPDYLDRQPTTNGKKPLYFFTHAADANQFYALCQARGLLAINAGRPFDETLLRRYAERHPKAVELKPLDRLDDPALYERLDAAEQAEYARLERAMDRALAEMETRVKTQVRRFRPDELSAVLLAGQRIAAFDAMEQALEKPFLLDGLAELAGEVRDRLRRQPLTLLLNATHPLVQRLGAVADPTEARYRPLLTGLYHAALLNAQHRLTPAAARRFHADLQALLLDHLELQVHDSSVGARN
ncbi:MAG: ATP-binding protein [Candidatus Contendobacter sp.]|nr:ATP-binding protein [Candidatus Contendobacter sp.]MDG4558784.1 ATP-binding protein [Candidatus Contendobacter sp.]